MTIKLANLRAAGSFNGPMTDAPAAPPAPSEADTLRSALRALLDTMETPRSQKASNAWMHARDVAGF